MIAPPDLTITLPLPPQRLKPNVRSHHMAKAKAVATYRETACDNAMEAAYHFDVRQACSIAVVRLHAFWPTVRRMDADNLLATMKAAFDGFTDAGLWTDDRQVAFLPSQQSKDKDNPRIEVDVWLDREWFEVVQQVG